MKNPPIYINPIWLRLAFYSLLDLTNPNQPVQVYEGLRKQTSAQFCLSKHPTWIVFVVTIYFTTSLVCYILARVGEWVAGLSELDYIAISAQLDLGLG